MISQLDRQLFRSWRARRSGKSAAGRIAVLGYCQSFGLAYGMKLLAPLMQVDRFALNERSLADMGRLVAELEHYDWVFTQDFDAGRLRGGGGSAELLAALPKARRLPFVAFRGFHPDTIYLQNLPAKGPKHVLPGNHLSALSLFAFQRGFSVDQTAGMFNRDVFETVGYFDVWNEATREFLATGEACGLNLAPDIARWARRGIFMNTPFHPRPYVAFDIAEQAMKQAKIPTTPVDFNAYSVEDTARGLVLPVYPALAEHYGARGSTLFKIPNYRLSKKVGDFLSLPEYIERSFAYFAALDRQHLAHPRVDEWLASQEAVRSLSLLSADALKRNALARAA